MPADAFMALGIYGQTVDVVPSRRLVIARFGTTSYDLRMAMVDIYRLTADTIAALQSSPQSRGGEPRALHERLELRPHDGRVLTLE